MSVADELMIALATTPRPTAGEGTRPRLVVSRRGVRRRPTEPVPNPLTNARIAVVMLLVAETMFFAGLVGAYLVFRGSSLVWPPPDLPRLPLALTWVNTCILMGSALAMLAAFRAAAEDNREALSRALGLTILLGAVFVSVQGAEWVRLIYYGLTISTGTYGSTFYVLIGTHAFHVLGGMLWLGVVGVGVRRGWFAQQLYGTVETCGVYWLFVCVLWLALFALVYH